MLFTDPAFDGCVLDAGAPNIIESNDSAFRDLTKDGDNVSVSDVQCVDSQCVDLVNDTNAVFVGQTLKASTN